MSACLKHEPFVHGVHDAFPMAPCGVSGQHQSMQHPCFGCKAHAWSCSSASDPDLMSAINPCPQGSELWQDRLNAPQAHHFLCPSWAPRPPASELD